jgi:hypothetical protein
MVGKLKLNPLIDILSSELRDIQVSETISDAGGFLVQSDPRMEFLTRSNEKAEYNHSAMPLLDITFQDSVMFIIELGTENRKIQTGRFILNQDSLWLLERKNALSEAIRLPLSAIGKMNLDIPNHEHLQKGRISDFLDSI